MTMIPVTDPEGMYLSLLTTFLFLTIYSSRDTLEGGDSYQPSSVKNVALFSTQISNPQINNNTYTSGTTKKGYSASRKQSFRTEDRRGYPPAHLLSATGDRKKNSFDPIDNDRSRLSYPHFISPTVVDTSYESLDAGFKGSRGFSENARDFARTQDTAADGSMLDGGNGRSTFQREGLFEDTEYEKALGPNRTSDFGKLTVAGPH